MAAAPMSKSFSLIFKSIQPRIDSYSGGDKMQDFRSFLCHRGGHVRRGQISRVPKGIEKKSI